MARPRARRILAWATVVASLLSGAVAVPAAAAGAAPARATAATTLTLAPAAPAGTAEHLGTTAILASRYFYPWVAGRSLLQSVTTATAPPASPTSSGAYTSTTGSLQLGVGAHGAGSLRVSVHLLEASRGAVVELRGGGGVLSTSRLSVGATGWSTLPAVEVEAGEPLSVMVRSDPGNGRLRVDALDLELIPARTRGLGNAFAANSFWYSELPDDALLDVAASSQVGAALAAQASRVTPTVNTRTWGGKLVVVPADQPLVTVRLDKPSTDPLTKVFATGLPVPPDWVPQADRDSAAVFYQPDYVGPCGERGRYFEAWRMRKDPDGVWRASWGGRMVGTEENPGYFTDVLTGCHAADPGHPDSVYQRRWWGTTATSLPLLGGEVSREDCAAGVIAHAVGVAPLEVTSGFLWPAQRDDGTVGSTSPVKEGMRLRFPADLVPPATLTPFGRMVFDAVQDHGAVVWDKAGALSLRAETECEPLFQGQPGWAQLKDMPWSRLQVLAVGEVTAPTR